MVMQNWRNNCQLLLSVSSYGAHETNTMTLPIQKLCWIHTLASGIENHPDECGLSSGRGFRSRWRIHVSKTFRRSKKLTPYIFFPRRWMARTSDPLCQMEWDRGFSTWNSQIRCFEYSIPGKAMARPYSIRSIVDCASAAQPCNRARPFIFAPCPIPTSWCQIAKGKDRAVVILSLT